MAPVREGFEAASLAELEGTAEVAAVDFGATWCSPCERQRPIFRRVARWFEDERDGEAVAFVTVDVDDNEGLGRRFHVKSVPTTLVLRHEDALVWGRDWREKHRFQGIVPFERLRDAILAVLD